ncbi:uncharacterized protein LOC114527579 [Dendronephthya gigantea]|uniref:uncharacterized protein LOC114527579 n=1 Tax=Dendronephthya gigantea TaxID=151771 RepID=UPI00106CAE97|nr:uncharacterized protein LOC114527579 [Dendronephthya gigantea]
MRFLGVLILLNIGLLSMAFKLVNKVKSGDHPRGFGTAKHALIIGIDGFGGAYMRNFTSQLPALQTFFDYGACTTESRNIVPTVSAPNWAGYLTSMSVTQSGVYSNDWVVPDGNPSGKAAHLPPISGRGRPQTLFSVIKEQNATAKTALIFTWEWFIQIAKKNPHVDNWFWGHEGIVCGPKESEQDCSNRQDWNVQQKTIEAIEKDQPTLTFIHFDAVDAAGHNSYWGSPVYYEMTKEKDRQVAGILEALEKTKTTSGNSMLDETIIAVVADHGGYRGTHGITPPMIAEVYVPLLLRGPGIANIDLDNDLIDRPDISSLDMPVTVLNALGIEPGKYMRGRVLEEIYQS